MGAFAGWELPEEFGGAVDEHLAVRTRAGLFDISHLGKLEVAGSDALAAVQRVTSNDASRLKAGETQPSALTTPAGTFVDRIVVHRLGGSHFLLVVDAAGVSGDVAWIVDQVKACGDVVVLDTSSRYAGVSLQGPAAEDVLQGLTSLVLGDLEPGCVHARGGGRRPGHDRSRRLHRRERLRAAGAAAGRAKAVDGDPAGGRSRRGRARRPAGARHAAARGGRPPGRAPTSTRRRRCSRRVSRTSSPGTRVSSSAARPWPARSADGVARRVVGFEMLDPVVAGPRTRRATSAASNVGAVTSGAETPFLRKAIGLASGCRPRTRRPARRSTWMSRAAWRGPALCTLPFYHRPER